MTTNQAVVAALRSQRIELPSWAFGNSGTRFKVFAQKGVPRDPYEKVADAAQVNSFTGVAPTVALHIPWDKVDDYADLARHAADAGVTPRHDQLERLPGRRLHARQRLQPGCPGPAQGARPSPRLHRRDGRDRLARPEAVVLGRHELPGPGRHPRPPGPAGRGARRRPRPARGGPADAARVQVLRAVVLHDGRARTGGRRTCSASRRDRRRASWSTPATTRRAPTSSSSSPRCCGPTDSAAFDFNSRFYADDDLMVGSADPFQLFRIMHEVVQGGRARTRPRGWRSCSTSATTSSPRSRARSGR